MLPECFHRTELRPNGRYGCGHPGLIAANGVLEAECLKCQSTGLYCNLPPAPHHISPRRPTSADFPCIHRGIESRTESCKTCGGDEKPVSVYRCEVLGECCTQSSGIRSPSGSLLQVCFSCDLRKEV